MINFSFQDTSKDLEVEKVMGSFREAHHIINKTSCFGVDYQPATPAPVQHHGKHCQHGSVFHLC